MVTWREKGMQADDAAWKERFRFSNCYFQGDIDAFLKTVSDGARGSTRRVQIVDRKAMRQLDPEGWERMMDALERFNAAYPEQSLRIVYREWLDGRGVMYERQPVIPGSTVCMDDDLNIYLTKRLG